MKHKVVARFVDGRILKGFTTDFSPIRPSFTLEHETEAAPRRVTILLRELKAVFFVKSFDGNPHYQERKLQVSEKNIGKRLRVTFVDGECVRGTTLGTNLTSSGFLLYPADEGSNNKRIFVLRTAIKEIREE